jgi:2-polyprenyl-3-methyl-5-hydroxy-6-metoxy-1,4-benzoquinol methylase
MGIEFTSHNIRLDDGTLTKPDAGYSMEAHPLVISTRRILETVFPGDKRHLRLADLGCLEGGFAVEFARLGFQVLGIEVREANIEACNYVKSKIRLPNLTFVNDNALNIANYGKFDVVFCSGLLYHFDEPKRFLETLSAVTKKLLILQTHFAIRDANWRVLLPTLIRKVLSGLEGKNRRFDRFYLSRLSQNEGLKGRWFTEFHSDRSFRRRETSKWASWDNRRSFWIQREYLLQAIRDVGFDLVLEQFDNLGPDIAASLVRGPYRQNSRGTFIGIKA